MIISDIGFNYGIYMLDKIDGYYEKLITVRCGGSDGIISMFSNYIYQSLVVSEKFPIISLIFEGMAFSKLRHLKMIEDIILNRGNASAMKYCISKLSDIDKDNKLMEVNIIDLLKLDIVAEEKSILENQRIIDTIKEPIVQAIFRNIIKDEKKHLRKIEGLYLKFNN